MTEKNPHHMEVATRLRIAAADLHCDTAKALSDYMDVGHSRVRNWLNGTSIPSMAEAIRLKEALQVTIDYIYTGDTTGLTTGKLLRLDAIRAGQRPLLSQVQPEPKAPTLGDQPASSAAPRRRATKRQKLQPA